MHLNRDVNAPSRIPFCGASQALVGGCVCQLDPGVSDWRRSFSNGMCRRTPEVPLTDEETHCIELTCDYLATRLGGTWRVESNLDDLFPTDPSPEVIVTNGRATAAIEVKRLTGDLIYQAYFESLLSNQRFLTPSCGGYYSLNPPVDFRLPMDHGLRRRVKKEIERLAPSLKPGERIDARIEIFEEPTGWPRVDRQIQEVRFRLDTAQSEKQYQAVGLLCRETLISAAQAVFDPSRHAALDAIDPSSTDAKRMLEAIFQRELAGGANQEARAHAKASLALALALQHRRTADFRMAAQCAEGTTSVVNLLAVVFDLRSRSP